VFTVPKIYCNDQRPRGGLEKVNFQTSETWQCIQFYFYIREHAPVYRQKSVIILKRTNKQGDSVTAAAKVEKYVNPLFKSVAISEAFAVLPSE
jgi:hypothetical protein